MEPTAPTATDQFESTDAKPLAAEPSPDAKPAPDAQKLGPLLDEPSEEKAARQALKLWNRNKKWHHRLAAIWMQNRMWRDGERFLKIIEDPASGQIRIAQPLGTALIASTPNSCDSKIRSNIAIFLADPPRPECEPWDDTPQARNSAQFATRLLTLDSGEAGLNTDAVLAEALDIAGTYASAFTLVQVDPKGGGLQPKSIKAHPDAKTVEEAETGPVDQMTGAPAQPKPPVSRYVMPDGTLSKESKGSVKEWTPQLVLKTMTGNHVRFLPRNVSGLDKADGVVFAMWDTLGSLRSKFPRVESMSDQEVLELVNWKIDDWKRLLPDGMEPDALNKDYDEENKPEADALVCTLHVYYKSCATYPYGAYLCFGGGKFRLLKQIWTAQTPANEGEQDETLDIPIAQMRWWQDAQGGNPYGKAPASKLGPLDEIAATTYASLQEFLFRFSRPRPYLPMGTTVQPEDLADQDRPIYVPPGGQPYFPPIPDYPQEGMMLADRIEQKMDDELSVPDAARGIAAGSVRSAEQQKAIIEQGLAGTSVVRANAEDYYERVHRIVLQLRRAFFKSPTLMRFQGDGGAFQVRDFKNVDLGQTREVRVRRGTFTLLAPTAKAGLISEKMQTGMISPQEAMRLDRENMAPLIGITENPHVERVKRQVWLWRQGPGEDVLQAQPQPQMDPMTGQPAVDPMTGQPVMIDPAQQAGMAVFTPIPMDADPQVALLRYQELGGACADAELSGFPQGWVNALYQAAEMARQGAGIMTIGEQQMAAQQQAQAQQQQEGAEREHQSQEKDKDRQHSKESQAAKEQATMDREAMGRAASQSGMMA